jgi:hypothetical protein
VHHQLVANLPSLPTTPAEFAAGADYTDGNFATGINDTGGKFATCNSGAP